MICLGTDNCDDILAFISKQKDEGEEFFSGLWRLLEVHHWIKEKPMWTANWWKLEDAFIAPWVSALETTEITVGKDFFWSVKDIFKSLSNNGISIVFSRPNSRGITTKDMVVNYCSKKWNVERRIIDIVSTHTLEESFQSFRLAEMLTFAGWDSVRDASYFVPSWSKLETDGVYSRQKVYDHIKQYGLRAPHDCETGYASHSGTDSGNESDFSEVQKLSIETEQHNNTLVAAPTKHRPDRKPKFLTPPSALNTTAESLDTNSSCQKNSFMDQKYMNAVLQKYEPVFSLLQSSSSNMVNEVKSALISTVGGLGWKCYYCAREKQSYLLSPWAQEGLDINRLKVSGIEYLSELTNLSRLSDYFLDSKEDGQLVHYLKSETFQVRCATFIRSQMKGFPNEAEQTDALSPFIIRNISPQRPLYRASDPAVHLERHVSIVAALSPVEKSSEVSSSEFPINEDPILDTNNTIEQLPVEDAKYMEEERDNCKLHDLLSSSSVQFPEVLEELKAMDPPWTWNYFPPGPKAAHLAPNEAGSLRIYLRPNKSISDKDMVFNEDYFYSEEQLLKYLLFTFGITKEMNEYDEKQETRPNGRVARRVSLPKADSVATNCVPPSPLAGSVPRVKGSSKSAVQEPKESRPVDELDGHVLEAIQLIQKRRTNGSLAYKEFFDSKGWKFIFEKTPKGGKSFHSLGYAEYVIAPWALEISDGVKADTTNYSKIDRDKLVESIDFFETSPDGLDELIAHLRSCGFRREQPVDNRKTVKKKRLSVSFDRKKSERKAENEGGDGHKESTEKGSVKASRVVSSFAIDSDEYLIAECLQESPVSYSKVSNLLSNLGWKLVYEKNSKEVQKVTMQSYSTYHLAPWADDIDGGYVECKTKHFVEINRELLTENEHFFDAINSREILYKYLIDNVYSVKKSSKKVVKHATSSKSQSQKSCVSKTVLKSSGFQHLGIYYEDDSFEFLLLQNLMQQSPSHSIIWDNLKSLGWISIYETFDSQYFVPPWAQEIPGGLTQKKAYYTIDRGILLENVDFFNAADRARLYEYILTYGFSRTIPQSVTYLEAKDRKRTRESIVDKIQSAETAKGPNSLHSKRSAQGFDDNKKQRAVAKVDSQDDSDAEFDVIQHIKDGNPSFAIVWERLKGLGWITAYEDRDNQFHLAPWALQIDGGVIPNSAKYYKLDRSKLIENVDFFRVSEKGALFQYLLDNGLKRKLPAKFDPSHQFPSARSKVHAVHSERTATKSKSAKFGEDTKKRTKKAKCDDLEFVQNSTSNLTLSASPFDPKAFWVNDDEYIMCDEEDDIRMLDNFDSIHFEKDEEGTVNTSEAVSDISHELSFEDPPAITYEVDSDEYNVLKCLQDTPVYYPKIWVFLQNLGWSTRYEKGRADCYYVAPWAWELKGGLIRGSTKVYVSIDRNIALEGTDFFTNRESMYEHLREVGFRRTPQDELFIATHSGNQLGQAPARTKKVKTKPTESSTKASKGDEKTDASPLKKLDTENVNMDVVEPPLVNSPQSPKNIPIVKPTLRKAIEKVYPAFLSNMSGTHSTSSSSSYSSDILPVDTVIRRDVEKETLTNIVKDALSSGQGCSVYMCGNPGTGKTITANSVLHNLRSLAASSSSDFVAVSDEAAGFRVIKLVGTAFVSSAQVYREIAGHLGVLKASDSDEEAKQAVIEHFGQQPRHVRFESGTGSSPASASGSDRSSSARSATRTAKKRKHLLADDDSTVPMTILLVDEVDMCKKDVVRELFELTSRSGIDGHEESNMITYSSLIFVGIGNEINFPRSLGLSVACAANVNQIVFGVYDNDTMMAILNHHSADLLQQSAAFFLISRVLQYRNGDVRVLVDIAIEGVKEATDKLIQKHASNPIELARDEEAVPIVMIPHMRDVCERIGLSPNVEERGQIETIDSLSPMTQFFITSLFVGTQRDVVAGLTKGVMLNMYRSYAELKHVLVDDGFDFPEVVAHVDMLVNYNIMKLISQKQGTYSLNVNVHTLMKVPSLANMHKSELQQVVVASMAAEDD